MRRAARLAVPVVAGVLVAAGAYAVLDGGEEPTRPASAAPAASPGRAVFARMGCGSCHRLAVAGARGGQAPDLDARLPVYTAATLRAKIVDPGAGSPTPGAMPDDFDERMTEAELDALVAFLLEAR